MTNNPNAVDNLVPFTGKDDPRNGRKPKGAKHLSTLIAEILGDDNLDWEKLPVKGSAGLQQKYGKNGWKAITYVAAGQAISGDRHAREWLRKSQYGDKVTHGFEEDMFSLKELTIKVVKSDNIDTERETTDSSHSTE